jgi:hypothetical protein
VEKKSHGGGSTKVMKKISSVWEAQKSKRKYFSSGSKKKEKRNKENKKNCQPSSERLMPFTKTFMIVYDHF